MVNFYPLTLSEQSALRTVTETKTNNEPILIIVQPTDSLIGVDADALQSNKHIDYFNAIRFNELKIVVIDPDGIETFINVKGNKEQEINNWYTEVLDIGFDTKLGFFLSLDKQDGQDLISRIVYLQRSISRGSKQSSDVINILDKDKQQRQFILSDFIEIITDYGEEYESLFDTFTRLSADLKAAKTVAEVNSIQVPSL